MKFVSYKTADGGSYGLVRGAGVVDLRRRFTERAPTLRQLLGAGLVPEAARYVEESADYSLDDLHLLPPIPDPQHVWCLAINYADHINEIKDIGINREQPKQPALFMRYADSLVGHGQPIIKPKVSDALDYEAELAVVIGKLGRNISKEDAMSYVAGYTCFNDGSVRDWQFHTRQIAPGKNFFATGALGPYLVTADEVPNPHALTLSTTLNGQRLQSGTTQDMLFDIPAFIAYVSAILPLVPGDILCSGTPAGVGFSRKPPIYMQAGDKVEVEVQSVGRLTNTIMAQP